ncbi:MAG: MAPEG family protein [Pseudomonadota bacterium]|jgi:hypothetical protein|nr:hypothetical protein [Alphaproteobacteria bacterium]MEC7703263.1 MAPEG family protein [Pseudomonadota bacterium]MEC9236374.1 MAPEG family protein [Pseudomonadota bacterium]MED5421821.1 MAPEG family protein [Pseudomonadota bacterium]|tara:strand:+ start:1960 stop:2355 length:396 start_codon:yes stop_codon:yes gene_type:complete
MIIGYYAGLLGLLFIVLTARIIRLRWKLRVGIGDGGEHILNKAIRVQSNFVEQVPLALLLIYLVEMQMSNIVLLHGLCSALLIGRVLHAFGLSKTSKTSFGRFVGMILTLSVTLVASLLLIYSYLKSNHIF